MSLNAMDAMQMSASTRSLRSMNHTNSNAQYAKTACERCTKQHLQSSNPQDSIPQITDKQILDLAVDLWNAYEYGLPDTPAQVAKVVFMSLKKNGYIINGAQ